MGGSEANRGGMATNRRTHRPLDQMPVKLRQYEIYVTEGLDDEDTYDTDALLALILRDGIEDRRSELSEEQNRQLERLDEVLASKYERLSEALPSYAPHDRSRWWWFLHEGPQVRE